VQWDAVELPSQVMENWVLEPEVLKLYARHWDTGEVIPESLVKKLRDARLFNQGYATVEYLAASYLDLDWHTLTKAPEGKSPVFMVYALRDTIGGNLDRIQIIKGWLDKNSKTHERIYDVAVSDGRKIDKDGRCKTPVGNTVDVNTASFTNTIGSSELGSVWTDPDFNPEEKAFYYARVIEIPTPRWTTIDAFRFGVPIPKGAPVSTQERAYTSPIWYTP
jgi:hypothetical protein